MNTGGFACLGYISPLPAGEGPGVRESPLTPPSAQRNSVPTSSVDRPIGRGACVIAVLGLLALFSIPLAAFVLATRGEIVWRRGEASDRLFLLNEAEVQGLGLESARPLTVEAAQCVRTRVRYFLWRGEGDKVEYCECGGSPGSCP